MAGTPAVEIRELTKSYGSARGVVGVDLAVEQGQIMGLVGANGAGKTTLMRTLLDFVRPTSGSISVFGRDSRRDSVEVRRRTTYLPGELVLPARLTGWEALRRYWVARTDVDRGRAAALADRLDLDLTRRINDLSKGNKQKVGLVLALAPPADLLVLDEPTSGLDPLLQREFAVLVREARDNGATVLLSSHVMSEIESIASHVALLREGRLAVVDRLAAIAAAARRRGRAVPRGADDLVRLSERLAALPGVSEVVAADDAVTFAVMGDADTLVKTLAGFDLRSLDLAHADLEDAFFGGRSTEGAP